MNIKKTIFLVALSGVILSSCSNSSELNLPKGEYDNGVLVANEGAFSGGTGTINFISEDYTIEEAKIYNKVNNDNIGTILQSIGFNDDNAYLIANVGNKISIANRYSMAKITEITGTLNNPRYIAFANGNGYVTNWGSGSDTTDDFIAVVDIQTATITSTISIPEGPEQIIAVGSTLYVSHKGGFGSGNTVSVINSLNNTIVKTIDVGSVPDEMGLDNDGTLLVSCEGKAETSWNPTETLGSLVKINTATNEVSATIAYASEFHPNNMVVSDGNIFFSTSSKVFKMAESATVVPTSEIITTPVYTLAVNENKIYVTDAKNFQDNGTLKIFDATTNTELKEFTVGLIPGKVYFN